MDIILEFKTYLLDKKISNPTTLKNYLSDLRHFVSWYERSFNINFSPEDFSQELINLYEGTNGASILPGGGVNHAEKMSLASTKRRLSSLRQFAKFAHEKSYVSENPFEIIAENKKPKEDVWHISEFKDYLKYKKASDLTVKNYVTDIHSFRRWYEQAIEPQAGKTPFPLINDGIIEEYKNRLTELKSSAPRTVNRKLSSIRKFLEFAIASNLTTKNDIYAYESVSNISIPKSAETTPSLSLNDIEEQKVKVNYSPFPPIRLFQRLIVLPYLLTEALIADKILSFIAGTSALKNISSKSLSSLPKPSFPSKPSDLLKIKGYEKEFYAPNEISLDTYPFHKKIFHHLRHSRPAWYKKYHSLPVVHYIHFAILIIFAVGAAVALYRNLVADVENPLFAAPTSPPRILSFQGRLTDNFSNPITSATDIRFAIYDDLSASGSALLWQEVHYDTVPDQDGIFSVLLGTNTAIPDSVFFENDDIYLGVTIESTSELTPRRRIASVPYAANSESLQGMLPITDGSAGQTNVVLALDSSGDLTIGGSATPTFSATGGSFTLSGEVLYLTTETGSDTDVIIAPDGFGTIELHKPLTNGTATGNLVPGGVEINDKFGVLATESAGAAFVLRNDGGGDLFTASTSSTTRFTIENDGGLIIPVYNTAGGIFYANGSGVINQTAAGSNGECLQSTGGGTPSWGTCGSGSNWRIISGAISPLNDTLDFLIGANSTSSAQFAVLNVNGPENTMVKIGEGADTPATLSISGGIGDNAAVVIDQLNNGNILAASSGGSTVFTIENNGDIVVGPNGSGKLTAAVIDPYLILNQYTDGNTQLTFQTSAATNGDFIFQNQSTELATLFQEGLLHLQINGSAGGLQIGDDVQLFRGSSNRLDVGSGDSINVVSGNVQIGGSTVIDSSSNATFNALSVSGGCTGCVSVFNSPFQLNNGAIVPAITTPDFLLGGQATNSAKFAVLGMNSDTPTASISALTGGNAGNGISLSSDGTIQSLRRNTLTVGGGTTGNIRFMPNNNSNNLFLRGDSVAIGNTDPDANLDVSTSSLLSAPVNKIIWGSIGNTMGTLGYDGSANNEIRIGATSNVGLQLITSDTVQAYITAGGNFGVGTSGPDRRLESLDSSNPQLRLTHTDNTTYADFQVDSNGDLVINVDGVSDQLVLDNGGNVGFGTDAPSARIDALGSGIFRNSSDSTDFLTIANSATETTITRTTDGGTLGSITLDSNGSLTAENLTVNTQTTLSAFSANGGILYTNGSGVVAQTSAGTASQCLIGGTTPTFGSCATGVDESKWTQNLGALYPKNSTVDFLLGGTATNSAKFAVLNMNTGTPTASISANSGNNATYLTGTGNLGTTNAQTLTLGGTSTGNIVIEAGGASGAINIQDNTNITGNLDTSGTLAVGTGDAFQVNASGEITAPTSNTINSLNINSGALSGVTGFTQSSGAFAFSGAGNFSVDSAAFDVTTGGAVSGVTTLSLSGAISDTDSAVTINDDLDVSGTTGLSLTGAGADISFSSGTNTISSAGTLQLGAVTLTGAVTGNSQSITGLDDLSAAGTITFGGFSTNGGLLYTNGSGVVAQTGAGTGSQCLLGGTTPTWGSCSTGGTDSPFQAANGAIFPLITTQDFLLGGSATTSAKFAVLNMNTGTPTASVSATAVTDRPGLYMTGTGTLSSVNKGTLTIGSSDTGGIVIGSDANARTIAIGNSTGATSLSLTSGTGGLALSSTSTGDITLNSSDTLLLDSAGVLELNSSGGVISIGNDAVAQNINIGTGAAARTIAIGNATGATALDLTGGTGGIDLLSTGTGDITIDSDDTLLLDADGVLELNSSAGAISIGNDADAQAINLGTGAAARTITLGNVTGATALDFNVGTGGINFGDNAVAKTIDIGGVTNSGTDTINIATNGTAADVITIGNSNASTTVAITGGNDWSIDAAGNLTVASCTGCGGASQTPWTSDIDADGFDLTDLSNIEFRDTTGAPAGTITSIFRDNTGDLNLNALSTKTVSLQVAGTDEYNFSSTALAMNGNNITGLGTTLSAAAGLTISTATNNSLTLSSAGTGDVLIDSDDTLLIDADGVLELNSSGGVISIGNDANSQNINIGTAGTRTLTIGSTNSTTALVFNTGTGGINFGDNANTKTIDIGGVTNSGTDTINIATNGTAADTIAIGNSNASTTVAITGGNDWSIDAAGNLTVASCTGCGGGGSSNWVLNSGTGTLSPINNTLDLLVGGTSTASAKFSVTNVAGSSNTRLDLTGSAYVRDLIAEDIALSGLSTNILTAYAGFDGYTGFTGGIGTGGNGKDSITGAQRIDSMGNLKNIASIQAGETLLTTGGTFATGVAYAAGDFTRVVTVADFNGDGYNDIAATNNADNDLSVFINDGDGTFATKVDYLTGNSPVNIASGDVNGDGFADLVVGNSSDADISVFINNGDGTFGTKVDYLAGNSPQRLSIGDLNGDGKNDIAVANYLDADISVFINNGDGTFGTKVDYSVGANPFGIAIGDLNGDGKNDIAVANEGPDSASVLINNGDGTFATDVEYAAGTNPLWISIADFDNDGQNDMVIANSSSNSISVFINNGDGTFGTQQNYSIGVGQTSVSPDDFNGDGYVDLAVSGNGSIHIFINDRDGTFTLTSSQTSASTLTTADFNNDGKPDIVSAITGSDQIMVFINNARPILYAQASNGVLGIGTTSPTSMLHVTRPLTHGVTGKALAIFDQIEDQDIFSASSSGTTRFTIENTGRLKIGTSGAPANNGLNPFVRIYNSASHTDPAASISARTTSAALVVTNDGTGDLIAASASGGMTFAVRRNGDILFTGTTIGPGADFAEYYKKENPSETFPAGTLICQTKNLGVTKCNGNNPDHILLGAMSDNPLITGGGDRKNDPNYVLVGLVGQLRLRVAGDIKVGDPLTLSSQTGVAVKATGEAQIIGHAMESNNNGSKPRIASSVQKSYYNPHLALNYAGDDAETFMASLNIYEQNGNWLISLGGNIVNRTSAFSNLIAANIKAGFINTQKIVTNSLTASGATISNLTAGVINGTSATISNVSATSLNASTAVLGSLSVGSENVLIAGVSLRDYIANIATDIIQNSEFIIQNGETIESPLANVNEINTNIISPLGDNEAIEIEVKPESIAINNSQTAETVVEIDNEGNATFSGTLASETLQTNDATISGTLSADRIIANTIDGLDDRISSVASNLIANNQQNEPSSPSAIYHLPSNLEELEVGNLYADFGIYSEGLTVLGSTTTSSLTAMDSIAIGTGFIMTDNSINTLGATLEIQPLRQGDISFMAGRVKIDTDGNVDINGNLNLAGRINAVGGVFGEIEATTLATNIISPLGGSDLTIKLGDTASNSGSLIIANQSNQEKLRISDKGDITASGSGTFDKLNFNLVGEALADSDTTATATGSAGFATLNKNRPEVTIYNDKVTKDSLIYITPFGDTGNKVIHLRRQVPHSETTDGSFTVGVSGTPSSQDIQFNWLIVN